MVTNHAHTNKAYKCCKILSKAANTVKTPKQSFYLMLVASTVIQKIFVLKNFCAH